MCGIAGIWHLNGSKIALAELVEFTDSMKHRGPDGSGYELYAEDTIGLGHRRLSVLDPTPLGRQPMWTPDRRYHITFNGEVYNFLELRAELQGHGYDFRTDSDTEVLLAAFHKWGPDSLSRLNGMWALAILDQKERSLFLARDRFGIKPLHFIYQPGRMFAFASETLAFKSLAGYRRLLDESNLVRAICDHSSLEAYGYTIYKDVYQVLPGHFLQLTAKSDPVQTKWWDTLGSLASAPKDYECQVEQCREIFASACRLRLRADVPIASALSGGLDSSSVFCMVHHLMQNGRQAVERLPENWQTAFVATFPGTTVDERPYAEQVVQHVAGRAHYVVPNYDQLVAEIERTTRLFDGVSGTPLVCLTDVYKAMNHHGIVVSLDGHGVDEMLYGYRNSVLSAIRETAFTDSPRARDLRATYEGLLFDHERPSKLADLDRLTAPQGVGQKGKAFLRKIRSQLQGGTDRDLLPPVHPAAWVRKELLQPRSFLTKDFGEHFYRKVEEPIPYRQFHYTELPYNLRDFDRGSMQSSVEVRMPFMDYRFVTFIFSLGAEAKVGQGFTKRILRDAMKNIIPEPIRTRKLKIGLGSPMQSWFNGPLAEYLLDQVQSRSFQTNPCFNGQAVRAFVEKKSREKSWTETECSQFWPVLNSHILTGSPP